MKRYRKILLFLALASVIVLAIYAPAPEDPPRQVRATSSAAIDASTSANSVQGKGSRTQLGEVPERTILGNSKADLFGTRSWQPPPPKVVSPPPGSLAATPPVPPPAQSYRFAGRLIQDGHEQLFVSKGDTPVAVKLGAKLDGYVVESVLANAIELVYPPLGHKERIFVPPAIPGDAPALPSAARTAPVTPSIPPVPIPPAGKFPVPR